MKLKYYLRGLGIGMIVTALILGISFSNRQDQTSQIMTDDQIFGDAVMIKSVLANYYGRGTWNGGQQ